MSSLQHRYPPVCSNCAPAVEAEIRKKDEYARTRALGGALKHSARPRIRSNNGQAPRLDGRESLLLWKVRGVLWAVSYVAALVAFGSGASFSLYVIIDLNDELFSGAFNVHPHPRLQGLVPFLPYLTTVSILWTFWDPTYSLRRRSRINGRQIRVNGLLQYKVGST